MKKTLSIFFGAMLVAGAASAAELTVYHAPGCPHCHHAREFISETLVKEYPDLTVVEINAGDPSNRTAFAKMIKECKLDSGGVPVVVIGKECFQGYGPSASPQMYRDALNKMAPADKADNDASAPAAQATESEPAVAQDVAPAPDAKKNNSTVFMLALLGILIIAVGFVALSKRKKK